jgi:hypothetical protein
LELAGYNAETVVMPLDHDLKRIVEAAVAELTALSRQDADRAREDGLAHGRTLGWEDGREQGRVEARQEAEQQTRTAVDAAVAAVRVDRSADLAASERLLDAVRAIDRGRSLSEILDTLVSSAGREAARAGVFVARGNRLRGWRFVGFPTLDADPAIDLSFADAGVIAEAVRTGDTASGETGAHAGPPAFARLDAGRESLAIPIAMAERVVAVLYADQSNAATSPISDRQSPILSPDPPAWPERLEILTRHAARCLEALTAVKAARALTEPPDLDEDGTAHGARVVAEREDAHASARRYARLLVSEIKLYHEPAVVAGRRDRDLSARLGGEITRARALYEQRVPADVRERTDYFFEELVRTLANGDATLLQLT